MKQIKLSPKNDFVIIDAGDFNKPKSVIAIAYDISLNNDFIGVVTGVGDDVKMVGVGDKVVFNSLASSSIKIMNSDKVWVLREEHIKAIVND